MTITLNNLEYGSNLICLTDVPNILKVVDDGWGTYATFTITFNNNLKEITTEDGQWHITFMNESIRNVLNYNNAINKSFFISDSNITTAASVARAFRNCPTVAANFNIQNSGASVVLEAKAIGSIFSTMQSYYETNIESTYLSSYGVDGTSTSTLVGAKIDVDIYAYDDADNVRYLTTLEKNFYNGEAAFNLSPVLTTFAEYGNAFGYTLRVSSIADGEYSVLGNIDKNYISVGYMCNQGLKYLPNDISNVAMNYSRGENQDADNNTILYTYFPEIPISIYRGPDGGMSTTVEYLDSAYNVIYSASTTTRLYKPLHDLTFSLNHAGYHWFNQAFYVDITLGTKKIRFNVIKPIKATEYGQRILWRNSYGGISFFDFTGKKEETRNLEISTYQKNIYNYYEDDKNELEKVYNNEVKYNVTLKSHLFANDGKYVFNDLLQSANVWTEINGEKYAIIIDSVDVTETDNNNVYEATVKYHYSQEPSLI